MEVRVMQPRETVKVPTVDCDAIDRAMSFHAVDVEDLLARVWAVSGFAGPPADHEARLLVKQDSDKLTDGEWEGEDGLRDDIIRWRGEGETYNVERMDPGA